MSSAMSLAQPLAVFLSPIVWSILIILRANKISTLKAAGLFAVSGFIINAVAIGPLSAAISLCAGMVAVLLLGLLNLTSRVTTLTLGIAFISLPIGGWLYPLSGLLLAGAISAVVIWRSRGIDYLRMATGETMAAVGFAGGTVTRPDLDRLPVEAQEDSRSAEDHGEKHSKPASTPQLSVPLMMLVGLSVGILVGIVFSSR